MIQSVIYHQPVKYITICLLFKKKKGNATVENISGDTVIGKYGDSDCSVRHMWYRSAMQRLFFLRFTDGSNNFLKICSAGGDVDVYVGDGGSADIQTQEGEFTVCELVKYTGSI